ncbi:hypothetical protein [Paenimyroides aestuarii]|uniref:Uncharacterized protein n=1 Tax=Paenimyroides aestuarii TaxID=2968490 RepID=A0ABY5NVX9_9FLAO|nr:hypothetical protein [Paenimyroides aestuarii]UUV22618.1 hypothetical protein NPX36_06125 [Paenimyroides aestuarii]
MKTKLLIILILLFAFKAGAQEPIFVKNIYATEIALKENGDFIKTGEKIYYPTKIIIDTKNRLVNFEYSTNLSSIYKLLKITIPKDKKHLDVYAEADVNKTVLFKIYDDKVFFIDTNNFIILFTKK